MPVPVMPGADENGNEPSEDEKQTIQNRIDEITKINAQSEKINEEIQKIQSKVKIAYRAQEG